MLDSDDVDEASVTKCSVDVERKLDETAHLKLHAGPGVIRRQIRTPGGVQTIQEKETRFILDLDLFASGNIRLPATMDTLQSLHDQKKKKIKVSEPLNSPKLDINSFI